MTMAMSSRPILTVRVFQRQAVQKQQAVLDAEHGRELVQNAALDADKLVLRPLAEPGDLHGVAVKGKQLLQKQRGRHFQRGRRRQPRPAGHVAVDDGIEAAHGDALPL